MIILAVFAENTIQLVPDGTLLLHLLIVVGMVAILNRTLLRPVNRILEEREVQTRGRLSAARKMQQNVEGDLRRYESTLRNARSAAYHLIESERNEALRVRGEKIALVKDDIRSWVGKERAAIERQAEDARKSLDLESAESAVRIGSQVLHRQLDSSPGY